MSIGARVPFARFMPSPDDIPPLEAGDELTRDEFERRYSVTRGIKKAELIEGVVHMPPPAVRWDGHASPHIKLAMWLGVYESGTPGVRAGDNASIRLDLDNEPQPDATMFIDAALGGQATISADDYVEGGPELVAEVSASSTSVDLNTELRVYRRNGVREYIVWRIYDAAIDWFELRTGEYHSLPVNADGIIRSTVFPGLWLDVPAMTSMDSAAVLRTLHRGMESAEHAAFVALLGSLGPRPADGAAGEP